MATLGPTLFINTRLGIRVRPTPGSTTTDIRLFSPAAIFQRCAQLQTLLEAAQPSLSHPPTKLTCDDARTAISTHKLSLLGARCIFMGRRSKAPPNMIWKCVVTRQQTKRDLGFLEGDLIECLNAGDGSWWTGRLRRDPRMVGSFPSNFVQVLDESFRPPSRCPSPIPPREPAPNPAQKTKSVRKPFQSYRLAASPNPETSARDAKGDQNGNMHSPSGSMRRPFSSMSRKHEAASSHLSQRRPVSQLSSPVAPYRSAGASSPLPPSLSRPVSPSINPYSSRAPSPQAFMSQGSPPPPPPTQIRYKQSSQPAASTERWLRSRSY